MGDSVTGMRRATHGSPRMSGVITSSELPEASVALGAALVVARESGAVASAGSAGPAWGGSVVGSGFGSGEV